MAIVPVGRGALSHASRLGRQHAEKGLLPGASGQLRSTRWREEAQTALHTYESKVYTPLKTSDNLGNGTAHGGGAPSTAAGNLVAFGCTEEKLLRDIYGARPRGTAVDSPFNHTTGLG